MASPSWSKPMDDGSIEFGYDDGSTLRLPPTDSALAMHDRLAGATAGLEDVVRNQLANGPPAPPPTATDAYTSSPLAIPASNPMPAAPANPLPTPATVAAGPISAASPPSELEAARMRSRSGFATGSGARDPMVDAEMRARSYGLTTMGTAPPPTEYGPPKPEAPAQPAGRWIPRTMVDPGGPKTTGYRYDYTEVHPDVPEHLFAAEESYLMRDQLNLLDQQRRNKEEAVYGAMEQGVRESDRAAVDAMRAKHLDAQRGAQDALLRTQTRIDEMRVDPDRFWKNQSAPASIGLAIAMAAGELAAGLTGRQNTVMQMIDRAIQADIAAQRDAIEKSERGYEREKGLYAEMMRTHENDEDALLASQAAAWEMVAQSTKQRAARMSDEQFAAASQNIAGAAEQRAAQIKRDLYDKKVAESVAVTDPVYSGGYMTQPRGAAVDPNDPTAGMSKEDAKAYRELTKDLQDHTGALADLNRAADSVRTSDAGTGILASRAPSVLLSAEGNRVRGNITNAIGRYGKAVYGAMTTDEYNRAKETATGSGTREETLNGLDTLANGVRASANAQIKKYPARVQEAFRRANPQLFEAETKGRAPGQ